MAQFGQGGAASERPEAGGDIAEKGDDPDRKKSEFRSQKSECGCSSADGLPAAQAGRRRKSEDRSQKSEVGRGAGELPQGQHFRCAGPGSPVHERPGSGKNGPLRRGDWLLLAVLE